MKKVALLIQSPHARGGLEKYALRTAEALAARGREVSLLSLGTSDRKPIPGITYVNVGNAVPLSVGKLWQFDWACQRYLKAHPHDITFGFDRVRHQTHIRAGNGVHAAYLQHRTMTDAWWKTATLRMNPLHQSLLHFERKAFEHPELRTLFTNSHMVRNEVLAHYQISPEKIQVVHNGVEWTAWESAFANWQAERAHFLSELRLPTSPFYFLFVGHGYRRKGLEFLLKGLARLKDSDAQLLVVGRDRERDAFQLLANRLRLEDRVHFLGARNDVLRCYQAADALAIPSTYDPFANVTLEGLAMGLYTVSSRYNGGSEIMTPEYGAIIEHLTNPDSVAAALQQALQRQKTMESAIIIRNSVQKLDFSHQLEKLVSLTLN